MQQQAAESNCKEQHEFLVDLPPLRIIIVNNETVDFVEVQETATDQARIRAEHVEPPSNQWQVYAHAM
jgi:hypothetical protein